MLPANGFTGSPATKTHTREIDLTVRGRRSGYDQEDLEGRRESAINPSQVEQYVQLLHEIVPSLDSRVLREILKGNMYDIEKSTDAALALMVSLSEEEGTPVVNGNTLSASAPSDPPPTSSSRLWDQSNSTSMPSPLSSGNGDRGFQSTQARRSSLESTTQPMRSQRVSDSRKDSSLASENRRHSLGPLASPTPQQRSASAAASFQPQAGTDGDISALGSRGAPVVLPLNFIQAPRFRFQVDREEDGLLDYSVIFRRDNEKLGVTITEVGGEVCISELHAKKITRQGDHAHRAVPCLAMDAGVQVGDTLTGINNEYFSPGVEVQDVIDILQLAGKYVTIHFSRRRRSVEDSDGSALALHKYAKILLEENVITQDRAMYVTNALYRLKGRVLHWDLGWIGQRVQNWKLYRVNKPQTSWAESASLFWRGGESEAENAQSSATGRTDVIIQTKELRPALSVRIVGAKERRDHIVYVIWVMDIRSGAEWVVERRFREFNEFRDLIVSVRQSISRLDFPTKRVNVTETGAMIVEREEILQRFLRKISSLVCLNSLHPSTARVQLALQQFLSVDKRIESILILEARSDVTVKNMVQVYVHSIMQMQIMDKVIAGFVEHFMERWDSERSRTWSIQEAAQLLASIRDFIDKLQNVLFEGIADDCVEILGKLRKALENDCVDNPIAQLEAKRKINRQKIITSLQGPTAGMELLQYSTADKSPSREQVKSPTETNSRVEPRLSSVSLEDTSLVKSRSNDDDKVQEMVTFKSTGEMGSSSSDEIPYTASDADLQSALDASAKEAQRKITMTRCAEDEMRDVSRSSTRRQIEIEIYVACAPKLRTVMEGSYRPQERLLSQRIAAVRDRPQTFFGIPSPHASPSKWDKIVRSLRDIRCFTLPHDRLEALADIAKMIPALFEREHPEVGKPLGADEFLPIFIYVLVRARIPDLLALNEEMQQLCDPEKRMSEIGYYLATLEASIQHIQEGDVSPSAPYLAQSPPVFSDNESESEKEKEEEEKEELKEEAKEGSRMENVSSPEHRLDTISSDSCPGEEHVPSTSFAGRSSMVRGGRSKIQELKRRASAHAKKHRQSSNDDDSDSETKSNLDSSDSDLDDAITDWQAWEVDENSALDSSLDSS